MKGINFINNKRGEMIGELLECCGCGGPHLLRNYPFHSNKMTKTFNNIWNSSTINVVPESIPRINIALDNR